MLRSCVCLALMAASVSVIAQQGQPQIGISPVTLAAGPYVFVCEVHLFMHGVFRAT